jgi:hypothetical protein
MAQGYVAFLDVLGFSALIAEDRDGTRLQGYLDSLTEAVGSADIHFVVFSDSIVLTIEGTDPTRLLYICSSCSRLMYRLITKNIAIRGAIACGEFVRESVASGLSIFVAGRAIIDAYRYEQLQDWVGVMLTPSARKQVPQLAQLCKPDFGDSARDYARARADGRLPWAACVRETNDIPFKPDHLKSRPLLKGFAVMPNEGGIEPSQVAESFAQVMPKLAWLQSIAPTPADQRKYDETRAFMSGAQDFWATLAGRGWT